MTEYTEWGDLQSGADIAGGSLLQGMMTQLKVPNGEKSSE